MAIPASEPQPILLAEAVRKVYRTGEVEVEALHALDLRVDPGELVAVMGPSGCGKSTLLNIIAGLDVHDEGEVSVAGESLTGKGANELARMRRAASIPSMPGK